MKELKERLYDEEIQTILSDLGASPVPSSIEQKDWYKKIILRHVLIDSTRYQDTRKSSAIREIGILSLSNPSNRSLDNAFEGLPAFLR